MMIDIKYTSEYFRKQLMAAFGRDNEMDYRQLTNSQYEIDH